MKNSITVLFVLLSTAGCAYHAPNEPSPTPPTVTPPGTTTPPVVPVPAPMSASVNFSTTTQPITGSRVFFAYSLLGGTAKINAITINFGDGTAQPQPEDVTIGFVGHTYDSPGEYIAAIRVDDSVQSRTIRMFLIVAPPPIIDGPQ